MTMGKKALAFYGAFNPPTNAHIYLAKYAMEQVGCEQVLFVPSQSNYIENDQGKNWAFTDDQRLEMLESIADNNNWMYVSYLDIAAKQQPRTYESLCLLKSSGWEPKLLIGADTLMQFQHHWQNVDKIAKEFGIVCLFRGSHWKEPKYLLEHDDYLRQLAPYIHIIKYPDDSYENISSSEVRKKLNDMYELQKEIAKMVPNEIVSDVLWYGRKIL